MHDALVIGGGIAGLCGARALALRGLRVALLEAGRAGQASGVAGGILSSMRPWQEDPVSARLSRQGAAMYPDFVRELREQTGVDAEYLRSGLLLLDPQDVAAMRDACHQYRMECRPVTHADADGCGQDGLPAWPAGADFTSGLFLPEIAQVRAPLLLRALAESLVKLGVSRPDRVAVEELLFRGQRCQGARAGGEVWNARFVVLSAGAWTRQLLREPQAQGWRMEAVRGQMLCLKFPQRPFSSMLLQGGRYLIPRQDGHVLLGSTMERVGLDPQTTEAAREDLWSWACGLWDGIGDARLVWHRAGLRPAADGGHPLVRRAAETENVFVHAGHFRKGILQAPVTAERLADLLLSREP